MKKFVLIALTLTLLISLAACAGPSSNVAHVKCPACGYEFDVESP